MKETGKQPPTSESADRKAWWTTVPVIITGITALIAAVSGLIIALNQAGVFHSGNNDGQTTTGSTTDFSSPSGLSAAQNTGDGSVEIRGDTMYLTAPRRTHPVLEVANSMQPVQDVNLAVNAEWLGPATDYGIGLVCRYQDADTHYLLAVLSGGRYNIVRYRAGRPFILRHGKTSSYLEQGSNDISATCIGRDPTTLTLRVNRESVPPVTDTHGIEGGAVGLRGGSGAGAVKYRLKHFVLAAL